MKIKNKYYIIYCLLFIFLSACKKGDQDQPLNFDSVPESSAYLTKLEFGKALSLSLNEMEVRELIKSEALKQFDDDYDVLFSNISNFKLSNGQSVVNFIASKSDNPDKFIEKISQLPLLNIFVPDLKEFSANSWDLNNEIPVVAVVRETDKKNGINSIKTYSSEGKQLELSYSATPKIPVIVIKDNERVQVSNVVLNNNTKGVSNRTYSYSFISEEFNRSAKKLSGSNRILSRGTRGDTSPVIDYIDNSQQIEDLGLRYAYEQKLDSQRDYIYYGIDSTKNITSGRFNGQYAEHIVSIRMESQAAIDKITDNWTEGNLEIVINVILVSNSGSALTIKKVINCNANDLKKPNRVGTNGETFAEYKDFSPIEIDSWDAYKYGDKWKFVVSEYDPGTETTTTNTTSTTFSYNFSAEGGVTLGIFKIGAKAGLSHEKTETNTVTIKTTDTSDDLYEGFLNFYRPVYSRKNYILPGRGRGGDEGGVAIVPNPYLVSTGAINIKVQPMKIQ